MSCAICLSNLIQLDTLPSNTHTHKTAQNDFEAQNHGLLKSSQVITQDNFVRKMKCCNLLYKCRSQKSGNEKLMLTPCKHIFHPECLKLWAEKKNECPVCRTEIPCIEE